MTTGEEVGIADRADLDGAGTWLALRWPDGITPHRWCEPARKGDDSPAQRTDVRDTAVTIADRLAQLHALGAVTVCSRPGRTPQVHSGHPSGADTTWMFPP